MVADLKRSSLGRPSVARWGPSPIRAPFHRQDSCGAGCTVVYGHDPAGHEAYGRSAALASWQAVPTGTVRTGSLVVDFDTRTTSVSGVRVALTDTEQRLLEALALRCGRVYPYAELLETVWDRYRALQALMGEGRVGQSHILASNLARLRAKLGASGALIETRQALGLMLRDELSLEAT